MMIEPNNIYCMDCLEGMKQMEDNSVDSIVTDPPYGLSFMGKKWDYDVPKIEIWKEALRVLKPGGILLSFAGSRTYHRMAVNIEDAGFEIRDQIMWVYGSGFPKSHNIGKAVDKRKEWDKYEVFSNSLKSKREELGLSKKQAFDKCGFEAETFGGNSWYEDGRIPSKKDYELLKSGLELGDECDDLFEEVEREFISNESNWGKEGFTKVSGIGEWIKTKGTSKWEGWGTALKPAHEPIVLARKPLSEKNVATNVLKWGTGGINIDECRVGNEIRINKGMSKKIGDAGTFRDDNWIPKDVENVAQGRFPANFIHDGSEEVVSMFPITKSQGHWSKTKTTGFGEFGNGKSEYQGVGHKDKLGGSAARFFYCAKTSKKDRNEGLEEFEEKSVGHGNLQNSKGMERFDTYSKNNHPTVKPTELMKYLIKLVTHKEGIVLDPFMGSGSTGKAATQLGIKFIGFEMDEEYCKIAKARCQD